MFDVFFQADLYIKVLLTIVLLGGIVFEIILFNRLRIMSAVLHQRANLVIEILVGILTLITIALLLTTLAIL